MNVAVTVFIVYKLLIIRLFESHYIHVNFNPKTKKNAQVFFFFFTTNTIVFINLKIMNRITLKTTNTHQQIDGLANKNIYVDLAITMIY